MFQNLLKLAHPILIVSIKTERVAEIERKEGLFISLGSMKQCISLVLPAPEITNNVLSNIHYTNRKLQYTIM